MKIYFFKYLSQINVFLINSFCGTSKIKDLIGVAFVNPKSLNLHGNSV